VIDFVELAEQRNAGIIDDDVERGMFCYRGLRERLDLRGLADIDAMQRDFLRTVFGDLGGERLQPRAKSQPRAANSSASARPMPLAAPVMAAAAPRIAVIGCRLHAGGKCAGEPHTSVSNPVA
jgi:hypothetical protein